MILLRVSLLNGDRGIWSIFSIMPFDPEKVLSQLQLMAHKPIPDPTPFVCQSALMGPNSDLASYIYTKQFLALFQGKREESVSW